MVYGIQPTDPRVCPAAAAAPHHSLQAISDKFGPVSLVHFDSHFDTWDEYFGEKCTHGTPFKRVRARARACGNRKPSPVKTFFEALALNA